MDKQAGKGQLKDHGVAVEVFAPHRFILNELHQNRLVESRLAVGKGRHQAPEPEAPVLPPDSRGK